jgi:hypothetical protein
MVKVLLLADTHLGFDQPQRPRVERRRRGPDFFANTRRALEPARPMHAVVVDATGLGADELAREIRTGFARLPEDAVVSLRIEGRLEPGCEAVLRAARFRGLHPPTMTVTLRVPRPT